jgi:hypothetical protein
VTPRSTFSALEFLLDDHCTPPESHRTCCPIRGTSARVGAARVVDGDPALAAPGELFAGFLPMALDD